MWRLAFLLVAVACAGCAPLPEFPFLDGADLSPPAIVELALPDPHHLRVRFDEPCKLVDGTVVPGATISGSVVPAARDHELVFTFTVPPDPAQEHVLEAQVKDAAGNHLRFAARFHGVNPLIPAMLINEFTTQGSGKHPDLVEIRTLSAGNLAGACLYEGVPGNWEQRFVFPDVDVEAGEYIVVHFKPEGLPEEVNEVARPDLSGGYDAHPEAWDFWVPGGTGLSGNNGVISLCENPIGGVLDAVLYSNRTSSSDERYGGFGSSAVQERAIFVVTEGAWRTAGDRVRPEDAVDPENSTATRSICRGSDGADTNARDDWHITPTRGLTPGEENLDDVYVP
jgi:hypothetical protein